MALSITRDNWREEVPRMVAHFEQCRRFGSSMYNEAMSQYRDMAKGGPGGAINFKPEKAWQEQLVEALQPVPVKPTVRTYNYPGLPNEFFAAVLIGLGEEL